MFSNFINYIFENQQVKRIPVLNIIVWTFCFLRPLLVRLAGQLDNLLFFKNKKQGLCLI